MNFTRLKWLLLPALFILLNSPIKVLANEHTRLAEHVIEQFGTPPDIPDGPLPADVAKAVQTAFTGAVAPVGSASRSTWGDTNSEALAHLIAAKDPRVVWLISDLLVFTWQQELYDELANAGARLLGIEFDENTKDQWNEITDHLIARDIPAYPDYLRTKRTIYTNAVHGWEALFVKGDIDWRMVSWGGVPIDARPYDETDIPCSCIPAVDNPKVTSVTDASWL